MVEQLEKIRKALLPAFHNRWPKNLLVYGPPGTGSTKVRNRSIKTSRAFSILHGASNVFVIDIADLNK